MKDGKPNLINFQLENGVYIVPKILDSGYLAIGKKKLPFTRQDVCEVRRPNHEPAEPIQEKAPKPPGLLPKNVQSWLLIGLASLMVLIMWLTGGKKPQTPAKAILPAPMVQAPLEVNEAKIAELQNRIEELQREQLVAQNALAQQTNRPLERHNARTCSQAATFQRTRATAPRDRPEDAIRAERKKRAYLSLFASNVALSYRKPPAGSDQSPAGRAANPACESSQPLNPTRLRSRSC